jgi:glutathione synthase/RimK-type ligase-like ATP-grasp enzyme
MIILLTNKFDVSVDYVVRFLRTQGKPFLRLNTEDLIEQEVEVDFPHFDFKLGKDSKEYSLKKEMKSVLYRRPGKPFEFSKKTNKPNQAVTKYIENQWHTFLESLCGIDGVLWINNPIKNHLAENKILQLKHAANIGFSVPKTCITSSREKAMQFSRNCGGKIIAKALSAPLIEYPTKDYFIFTSKINALENIPSSEFKLAPSIFQEEIADKEDFRVTIVGNSCFAVKIETSDSSAIPIDWRLSQKSLRYIPTALPSEVETKCLKLTSELGLIFGAIDLVKSNGKFYFLEINPSGEWGWLQKEANLPIAETLATYLMKAETK